MHQPPALPPGRTPGPPVASDDFTAVPLLDLAQRLTALSHRDAIAHAIATLIRDGRHNPAVHTHPATCPPLTRAERLEMLALGEAIHRAACSPTDLHHAVTAGAGWGPIATALGITPSCARSRYRRWADGEQHLHQITQARYGLNDQEHQQALTACAPDRAAASAAAPDGDAS